MQFTRSLTHIRSLMAMLFLLLVGFTHIATAQSSPSPGDESPNPSPSPTPSLESQLLRNVLSDQRAIWTAPFYLKANDAKMLVPFGAGLFALIATDRHTSDELVEDGDSRTRRNISGDVSELGSFYATAGIAGTFYLAGVAGRDWRARETGILGAEALIDSGIVTSVLKAATQRPRPPQMGQKDDFFDGGNSFPSGHAASAWTLAAVVACEYHDKPVVQVSAYGLATAVSLSRYTGRKHFLSDVLFGGALGYSVGRYVCHKHHIDESNLYTGEDKNKRHSSIWLQHISPIYSPAQHNYGIALNWSK